MDNVHPALMDLEHAGISFHKNTIAILVLIP